VQLSGAEIGTTPVESRNAETKRAIQMVFQNPDSTLNPSHSIGYVLSRAIRKLRGISGREARIETETLLKTVNLPEEVASRKPRHLAGGFRRREAPPAFRRAEAAGGDRAGAGRRARTHPRRRAGLGARRLGAGGDHQPAGGDPAEARRHLAVHLPRPLGGALS